MSMTAESPRAANRTVKGMSGEGRWVTFRLGGEKYAINVMQVREVLKVSEIAPVPGAPGFVLGIINLRGNVVTVVDARHRFGLPPREADDATRIIIIDAEHTVVGLMVDSVAEVMNIDTTQIEVPPNVGSDESAKFLQGVSSQGEELVILVDLGKMLEGA